MPASPRTRFVKRRNRLIERNLFLVMPVARRIRRSLPNSIDLDEMLSDGALGLLSAAMRFEPARGVPFARFATRYIRGAMIDGVRRRRRAPVPVSTCDRAVLDERFDQVDARADAWSTLTLQPDPRRRLMLVLYYFDQLTMKRIGRMLGITEPRISQLMKQSLDSVRRGVSPRPEGERFSSIAKNKSAPVRVAANRRRAA